MTGTVPVDKDLLTGTVPVNKELLTGTVPVNKGSVYFMRQYYNTIGQCVSQCIKLVSSIMAQIVLHLCVTEIVLRSPILAILMSVF